MAIEQTGGCLFQRKTTQNMDISICKNSIKETQVARESKSGQKKKLHPHLVLNNSRPHFQNQ